MLTFMEFSGSPYHIGLALGRFGAEAVHGILMKSPAWERSMLWRNHEQVRAMQELVEQEHPYIWDELQGLARGLELPPHDVFVWNCRADLPPLDSKNSNGHDDNRQRNDCNSTNNSSQANDNNDHDGNTDGDQENDVGLESTTILLSDATGPRIVHSHTGCNALHEHCAIAEFNADPGGGYAAFISPGSLPGHTFGVTGMGLAYAVNLVPATQLSPGIPTVVLARALLEASDLGSAVNLLNGSPRAGQAHVGVGQRGGSTLLSIEFNPDNVSIQPVKLASVHTNHLVHDAMLEHDRIVSESSRQRYNDANAMLRMNNDSDAMQILTDHSNALYPLHRSIEQSSVCGPATLALADVHIGTEHVLWDIYTTADMPARFRMCDAKHI